MQPKLLRVLESRTVKRLGESEHRPIDVRLVAATHRDLRRDGQRRARSARISTSASRCCRWCCRRCARARATSRCCSSTSWRGRRPVRAGVRARAGGDALAGQRARAAQLRRARVRDRRQGGDAVQPRTGECPRSHRPSAEISGVAFDQPFKEFRERWIDQGEREYLQPLARAPRPQRAGGGGGGGAGSDLRLSVDPQARPLRPSDALARLPDPSPLADGG